MLRRFLAGQARPTVLIYPLIWMVVVFVLSSVPGGPPVRGDWLRELIAWIPPAYRDLLHLPAYAMLAFLWCLALRIWPMSGWLRLALGFVIAVGFGVVVEWHQIGIPGRVASVSDALLNATGALVAVALYTVAERYFQRRGRIAGP